MISSCTPPLESKEINILIIHVLVLYDHKAKHMDEVDHICDLNSGFGKWNQKPVAILQPKISDWITLLKF